MIERAHETAEGALPDGGWEVGAGGLGLLHQIGEREDGIPRDDALGFASPQGDVLTRLAPYYARVGHAALECLRPGSELPPPGAWRAGCGPSEAGLLGAKLHPRCDGGLDRLRASGFAGPLQIGKERPSGRQ